MLFEGPLTDEPINYGTTIPTVIYIAFVALIYWVIAPILLVIAASFFFLSYLSYKYLYVNVIVRKYESGGKFWYGIYYYSMVGLMISVITIVGLLALKQGVAQVFSLVPLFIVIIISWRYTEKCFKQSSLDLPMSSAVAHDKKYDVKTLGFTNEYITQRNATNSVLHQPIPYHIGSIPLVEKGRVSDVYYSSDDSLVESIPLKEIQSVVVRNDKKEIVLYLNKDNDPVRADDDV